MAVSNDDRDDADHPWRYSNGNRAVDDPRTSDADPRDPPQWPTGPAGYVARAAAAALDCPACYQCGGTATTAVAARSEDAPLKPYCDACGEHAIEQGGREYGLPSFARVVTDDDRFAPGATTESWGTRDGRYHALAATAAALDAENLREAEAYYNTSEADTVSLADYE